MASPWETAVVAPGAVVMADRGNYTSSKDSSLSYLMGSNDGRQGQKVSTDPVPAAECKQSVHLTVH